MQAPQSSVGKLLLELVHALTPSDCLDRPVTAVELVGFVRPTYVEPPPCTLTTALPMRTIAGLVLKLMSLTEQCLYRLNNDDQLDEGVLSIEEVDELASDLRTAVSLSKYPIHEEFEFKPNQRTSVGGMIFILETRFNLFCHMREWESVALADQLHLSAFPTLARQLTAPAAGAPLLYMTLSEVWCMSKQLTDRWLDFNRDDRTITDVEELLSLIETIFARISLLVNTPFERDTLDVSEYVQPIETAAEVREGEPQVIINAEFIWDFSIVYHALFQDLLVFSTLMARVPCSPPPQHTAVLDRYRPHIHDWLLKTMVSARGDDLVQKFEDFYRNLVERKGDIGQMIRVGRLERINFDKYHHFDEMLGHSDPVIVDAAYKFAVSYVLEQQCGGLPWSDYVAFERIEPQLLWDKQWADGMPRIVRLPLLNNYGLLGRGHDVAVFDHPLDAWIVWLYAVRDRCGGKVKHPESGLWITFEKILHTFEVIEQTKQALESE